MMASRAMRVLASARISAGNILRRNLASRNNSASPHSTKQPAVLGAMRFGGVYWSSFWRNNQESGPLSQPIAYPARRVTAIATTHAANARAQPRHHAELGFNSSHNAVAPRKKLTAVPPGFIATIPGITDLSVSTSSAQPIKTRTLNSATTTLVVFARSKKRDTSRASA